MRTNLGRDAHGLFKLFLALMRPFMASPEKGAQTSIYAAAESSIETVNGHIFAGNKCTPLSSNDEADAKRLWKISAQLTTL